MGAALLRIRPRADVCDVGRGGVSSVCETLLGVFGAVAGGVFGFGWMLFHLLVIPLQAYIFMMLTIVYLSLSEDSH